MRPRNLTGDSFFTWDGDTLVVNILGKPSSRADAIGKPLGTQLKVSVTASPEGGRATDHMVRFLAPLFGVAVADIETVSVSGVPVTVPFPVTVIPVGVEPAAPEVPVVAATLATMIGLGVGIDYALFIVTRYRQHLHEGMDPEESTILAITTAGTGYTNPQIAEQLHVVEQVVH